MSAIVPLFQHTDAVGNEAGTLYADTIPGGTLSTGDELHCVYLGYTGATTNIRRVWLALGPYLVANTAVMSFAVAAKRAFLIDARVLVTGPNTVTTIATVLFPGCTSNLPTPQQHDFGGLDLTGGLDLSLHAFGGANGDVVATGGTVDLRGAA